MFEQLNYDANGIKTVCEMDGKHSDMLMNIRVKKFKVGETFTVYDESCESAFLILYGDVNITWNNETKKMTREKRIP